MEPRERIIVALDVDKYEEAEKLVIALADVVDVFKVGMAPYQGYGEKILTKLQDMNKKVFLDLKFHDIPNTVYNVTKIALEKNVFMMNYHCAGGSKMLKEASRAASEKEGTKPILLGVTILTSMDEKQFEEVGYLGQIEDKVIAFAKMASLSGMNGVVASPKEAKKIKEILGKEFIVVTPGIRPLWSVKGDQKRVLTPADAVREGSDYLVIGRPIIKADNPKEAAQRIIDEIASLSS